jgi:hypothetical protein
MPVETVEIQCRFCSTAIPDGFSDGEYSDYVEASLCVDCGIRCECCEYVGDRDESRDSPDGDPWCPECYSERISHCLNCGEGQYSDYMYSCDDHPMCEGGEFCHECYEEHEASRHGSIHAYGYKPQPQFMGRGPRYFGVELEIDGAGETPDNADEILEHSKDQALFYIKSDSSLNDGMEIVTHPASLEYHMKKFPWEAITRTARGLGYKSHDAGTCGLHVHVSREALGRNRGAQELTVSKLIVLLWRHWPKFYRFSRRDSRAADEWCRQQYSYDTLSSEGLVDAKRKGHSVALNVSNDRPGGTIEFRLFRGSLNPNTLRASIGLVDVLVTIALSHGIVWVAKSRWKDIIAECKSDRNLWQYLVLRGLTD